jgi:hypothetical protein
MPDLFQAHHTTVDVVREVHPPNYPLRAFQWDAQLNRLMKTQSKFFFPHSNASSFMERVLEMLQINASSMYMPNKAQIGDVFENIFF